MPWITFLPQFPSDFKVEEDAGLLQLSTMWMLQLRFLTHSLWHADTFFALCWSQIDWLCCCPCWSLHRNRWHGIWPHPSLCTLHRKRENSSSFPLFFLLLEWAKSWSHLYRSNPGRNSRMSLPLDLYGYNWEQNPSPRPHRWLQIWKKY